MNTKRLIFLSLLTLAALLGAPASGLAQSILQSAGNFGVLGGTAITNAGAQTTDISNGNVGLSPGATTGITGFPPAIVTNGSIIATGGITAQAQADLTTAANALAGMATSLGGNLSTIDLGTVAPLLPGVYTYNGAAQLTGALVLNANFQNDVAWVFQIGTSLTTAALSSVTIINAGTNGGIDDGIFFDAGAGITLGANNQFQGNLLAGTSITLGTGSSDNGRLLAGAAVSLGDNTSNATGGGGFTGGLTLNGATATTSGSVLESAPGNFSPGTSGVILTPGVASNTTSMTIDGNITDGTAPTSLTITGASVTLSGANSYTAGTFVTSGTLTAGSSNLPTNGNVTLTNSALIFDQTANGTFGGVISGSGSVTEIGTSTLTLSGLNTYSNGTFVNSGTLVANSASLPANGNVTLASGGILAFDQTAAGSFGGVISGGGSVNKFGTGILTLTGANAYTGGTKVNFGLINFSNAGNFGTGTITLNGGGLQWATGTSTDVSGSLAPIGAGGGTLDTNGNNVTLASAISGAGALTKFGTGTLTLSAVNTFAGGTTISAGTVAIVAASGLGTGALTLNGGALQSSGASITLANAVAVTSNSGTLNTPNVTLSGVLSGTGTLTMSGAGTLALTNEANTFTGTLSAGASSTISGDAGSITGNINSAGTTDFNQAVNGTHSAVIAGSGSVVKLGVGTLALTGANTFTGGTTVNAGLVNFGNAGDFGTGNITLNGGGLQFATGTSTDISGRLAPIGAAGGTFDTNGNNVTLASALSGAGAVTKIGTGTLTLSAVNTFAGGTTISAGTVAIVAASGLGSGALTLNGGTLQSSGASITLANAVAVTSNSGTLNTPNATLSGVLSGAGTLTMSGAGTLDLTNEGNTFTGTLSAGAGSTIAGDAGSITGNVNSSGTTAFNQVANGTESAVIAGSGSVLKTGAGTLALTGANTFTGGTTVSAGLVNFSNAGNLGTGPVTLNGGGLQFATGTATDISGRLAPIGAAGGTFDTNGNNVTLASALSGVGAVTKIGTGTLTLSGVNTFAGGTTVSAGTVAIVAASGLGSGALTLNGGALQSSGTPIVISNPIAVTSNSGTVNTPNSTLSGVLSGSGTLTLSGAGTLSITNAGNTFTGTLAAGPGTTLEDYNSSVQGNINSTGTTTFNQTSDSTYNGVISGGGTIDKAGASALTLSNTTGSPVNVQAGTLFLGNISVGSTTISSGATLRGDGTIVGNLLNNGTLSAGFSPGTINVNGNFTQGPGGTLVMEIASASSFDHLVITGTASIAGTLVVDALGGFNPTPLSFQVLAAAGGLTGTFSTVTGGFADESVVYSANTVTISFLQFNTFAGTPNQVAVANAAQSDPAVTAVLATVTNASAMPGAFNAISPQGYEIWSTVAFARAAFLANRMERMGPAPADSNLDTKSASADAMAATTSETPPDLGNFYFDVSQQRGTERGDQDVGAIGFTDTDALVGLDRRVGPNLTLGGFFDYGETNAGLGSPGSNTDIKDYTLGARADWTSGPWFVDAVVDVGFDQYGSNRPVAFPGTFAAAASDTHGEQWTAALSAGQHDKVGAVTLSPFLGLMESGWRAAGFTETGAGIFDNTVDDQSAHSLQSQVGLDARLDWKVGTAVLHPHVGAAWIHEYSNDPRSINSSFGGVGFTVITQGPQRDSALFSAGLDAEFGPRVRLYSELSVQTGTVTRVLTEIDAGLAFRF